jgi:aspartyl protease family protein
MKCFLTKYLHALRLFLFIGLILMIITGLSGCSGCSKSGSRSRYIVTSKKLPADSLPTVSDSGNTVKMTRQDGVYQIPVSVNNVPMYFIFDTGASFISLSAEEAAHLHRLGFLEESDVKGTAKLVDANGDISSGVVVNLREVKIGNKVIHDVEATVMSGINVPLLMGQSALERFGRISIDYNRGEISFE